MEIKKFKVGARNSIKKDISKLIAMCGSFVPLDDWFKERVDNASDIFYALDGQDVLGYLIADKQGSNFEDTQDSHLEIELICVGLGGRGKGTGKALMAAAEELARSDKKIKRIELDSQFSAESFYEGLDFKAVSRNPQGVRMIKFL